MTNGAAVAVLGPIVLKTGNLPAVQKTRWPARLRNSGLIGVRLYHCGQLTPAFTIIYASGYLTGDRLPEGQGGA